VNLVGQLAGALGIPGRQHAGMHHQVTVFEVRQRPGAQPVEQFGAIGGGQDVVQRVAAMGTPDAPGHREQVQVVVAQDRHGPIAQAAHETQGLERGRAAVDQVTDEPQRRSGRVALDLGQQAFQAGQAALQVADHHRHRQGFHSTIHRGTFSRTMRK
jgi:hypothetical protein